MNEPEPPEPVPVLASKIMLAPATLVPEAGVPTIAPVVGIVKAVAPAVWAVS